MAYKIGVTNDLLNGMILQVDPNYIGNLSTRNMVIKLRKGKGTKGPATTGVKGKGKAGCLMVTQCVTCLEVGWRL